MQVNSIMRGVFVCLAVVALGFSAAADAGNVLIINGVSATSEPGTTASITTNLQTKQTSAGNTVTVVDVPPASLAGYDEVWDIRFSDSSPLTASDQTLYQAFLASGKRMFVMGENGFFITRNNSIIAFVAALGGGSLTFGTPAATQTVNSPYNAPNVVSTILFNAPGGLTIAGKGSGAFVTQATDGSGGTSLAWVPGTMTNASAGTLVVVFDVNFMQTDADANLQAFLSNLIHFINGGPQIQAAAVPALNAGALAILAAVLACAGFLALARRRT